MLRTEVRRIEPHNRITILSEYYIYLLYKMELLVKGLRGKPMVVGRPAYWIC